MTVLLALAVAVCFGSGAYLVLKRDLIRVIAGMIMLSNSVNLYLMASGLTRGAAPILPTGGETPSDPLVQAMVLTAVVITFGTAALLLGLVWRVYTSHGTVDGQELRREEERREPGPRAEGEGVA